MFSIYFRPYLDYLSSRNVIHKYFKLQISEQPSYNQFKDFKVATETGVDRNIEPKVTIATTEKQKSADGETTNTSENKEEAKNPFEDIPDDFLDDLTKIFDELGINDSKPALDFDIDILSQKLVAKGRKNELVIQLLRQWRKALLEAIEEQKRVEAEIERKKSSRRSVSNSNLGKMK